MTHDCKGRPELKDVVIRLNPVIAEEEEAGEQAIVVLTRRHDQANAIVPDGAVARQWQQPEQLHYYEHGNRVLQPKANQVCQVMEFALAPHQLAVEAVRDKETAAKHFAGYTQLRIRNRARSPDDEDGVDNQDISGEEVLVVIVDFYDHRIENSSEGNCAEEWSEEIHVIDADVDYQ